MKKISDTSTRLNQIDYHLVERSDIEETTFDVELNDYFKIVYIEKETFQVNVSRKIKLNPNKVFEISISSDIIYHLEDYEDGVEYTEEYISENIVEIINKSNSIEYISLLISQITASFGSTPLITPNVFVFDKGK